MAHSIRRRDVVTLAAGAAILPLAAHAQQRALPVIGYLHSGTASSDAPLAAAFRRGLAEHGYLEGGNVQILYRYADNQCDRLPALAEDLVRHWVAVIAAMGISNTALTAKAATTTIPIVFVTGGDPVEVGVVASLNRPGGNVTGINILRAELAPKRLELLHEIVPAVASIGYLYNPATTSAEGQRAEIESAARTLGVRLVTATATTPNYIEPAFAMLVNDGIGAFLSGTTTPFVDQRDRILALAAKYRLPAMYADREFVEAGGLLSYGPSLPDAYRLTGTYVGRVLKGDKPADLPVQQSTRFNMVLNLKTAKALGIEVPTATLLRATEVIE